jgi:hypothetical protein
VAHRELLDLRDQRDRLIESFPTVMVMQDSPVPRETHVLVRGAYDRPGQRVDSGVPSVLPPLPAAAPNNRLGLAKWIMIRLRNPFRFVLIALSGWMNGRQLLLIDYLREENRVPLAAAERPNPRGAVSGSIHSEATAGRTCCHAQPNR